MIDTTAQPRWQVVTTRSGRYSVWPAARQVPDGWTAAGSEGDRSECLAWIAEHWTDERPAGVGAAGVRAENR
ncbi:MbtH family NRPS accessory protein [Streptomyces olivaceus]|uniref:MbtH family NRPS accessory protein n=1 Tax=Streptomyces olivaceus TaxID=47716 RepID=UPI0036415E4D